MNSSSLWILQHGWGCNRSFWNRLQTFVPQDVELQVLDRGYFGDPISLQMKKNAYRRKVVVTHSFGLHLLPNPIFQNADVLVIFSGFSTFHASPMNGEKESIVDRMLIRMEVDPLDVLARFQRNCFLPACLKSSAETTGFLPDKSILQTRPSQINQTLLIEDLALLNRDKFDIKSIAHIPRIVIIHGEKDQIVPLTRVEELHRQLPRSKMIVVERAGHALPITHSKWCCEVIEKHLMSDER